MGSTPAKDWKALRRTLKRAGCRIEPTGSNHERVYHGDTFVVTLQQSPSSDRSYRNAIAQIRRAKVPGFTN